jgi:hypothetical protein
MEVYPFNPKSAQAYRQRKAPVGSKTIIARSVEISSNRFSMGEQLRKILVNAVREMGLD